MSLMDSCLEVFFFFLIYYLFFFIENDIERLKRRIETLVRSNDEKVINNHNYQTVYLHTVYIYIYNYSLGKKN